MIFIFFSDIYIYTTFTIMVGGKYNMKRFLSLVVIGTLVISMVGAFPAVADEEHDQLVLIRDVGESEDISDLEEAGDVLDRYGRYVLLETSDSAIEKLEYNYGIDMLENRNRLNIKGHEFDTNEEYPDLDPELMIDEYEPGTEGLYIVDMIGPVNPEWRRELEELGVEVINYQPNYAYEVSMTPEKADKVEGLFFVDWVGVYQPAFKLAEDIEPGNISVSFSSGETSIMEVEDEDELVELANNKDVYFISQYVETEPQG